ncbi:uncharacterized protein LOC143844223 isoform X2 [Paroedura picta]|uniref:uncharacterized protein LOC143844223 isoform X2 n=1 Tax=Paroedura picta TaxID=143630 RepID=UPI0040561281
MAISTPRLSFQHILLLSQEGGTAGQQFMCHGERLHRTNTSEGSACSSGQEGPCARSQEMPNGAHSGEEAEDVAAEQHLEQPVCG